MDPATFTIIVLVIFFLWTLIHRGVPGVFYAARGKTPPWVETKRAKMALKDPTTVRDSYGFRDLGADLKDITLMNVGKWLAKKKVDTTVDWKKVIDDATKRLNGTDEDEPTVHDGGDALADDQAPDTDDDAAAATVPDPWTAKPLVPIDPDLDGELTDEQKKLIEDARAAWDNRYAWTDEKQDLIKAGKCPWQEYDEVTTWFTSPCRAELAPGMPYCARHCKDAGYGDRTPPAPPTPTEPGADNNEENTDADTPPTCTQSMNCPACVLVNGVPTCMSDLKPDVEADDKATEGAPRTDQVDTPPPATDAEPVSDEPMGQLIPLFPDRGDQNMTTTEAPATTPTATVEVVDRVTAMKFAQANRDACSALVGTYDALGATSTTSTTAAVTAASHTEKAVADLTRGEVRGKALVALNSAASDLPEIARLHEQMGNLSAQLKDKYAAVAAAFSTAFSELSSHQVVDDAFGATRNEAGGKPFSTGGAASPAPTPVAAGASAN